MSFLDTVVTVNVTATSATPTLPGFGIPAILAYHTHWTDRIRTYTDLAGMTADGFTTTEPAYLMAQSIVQQSPRPTTFKVIRGTTSVVQTWTFTVTDNTDGHSVGQTVTSPTGVVTACYHTVAGETTAQVATAVAALIDAIVGVGAAAVGSVVTVTADVSGTIWYSSLVSGGNFADTSPTVNPATDLDATILIDATWYGISGAWLGATNILLIAAWAETNKRLHGFTTMDSDNLVADSGVIEACQDLSYKYSYGLFSLVPRTYGATGWLGGQLTAVPGSNTWAYKQIAGTSVDALTPTQETNLTANGGNFYITMAGVNVTFDGRTASGQYIDITVGIDSLSQKIQLRVATLLTTMPKLPFTRAGISLVRGAIMAALQDSIRDNFLSNDAGFEPSITIPDLATISPADKADRLLRTVNFSCTAQGAIHKVRINGVVTL